METRINIGIAGAAARGKSFKKALDSIKNIRVNAVCDINGEKLEETRAFFGADEKYTDYFEMLKKADINTVVIATPMPLHASQAIQALKRDMNVLSEVPAAVSLPECKKLVKAAENSKAVYMMAENYTYMKPNVLVKELVKKGVFGETYYAEGEYIHELKELNEKTPWRRKYQTGINGITYGTHSLGPILQWMPGDRVISLTCAGSGHHYKDPGGDFYENEDSCVMLCKTLKGALIKIRVDMLSDRPHAMTNYSLQGTDGSYESARSAGEKDKIWLRGKSRDMHTWSDTSEFEDKNLPKEWKKHSRKARASGHGGGDYFEILDFANALKRRKPCPIGIHEAMDMTLPGLISQQSITKNGRWLKVPDSRNWSGKEA